MDAPTRSAIRSESRRKRRPPSTGQGNSDWQVPFCGTGILPQSGTPTTLTICVTDEAGELAPWFDDYWWTDVLQRWMDFAVTVAIAPTPSAILHPVVLYHMEMIRRIVPQWRIVGRAFAHEFSTDEGIAQLAASPYHEVHVLDGAARTEDADHRPLEEIFAEVRRMQQKLGTRHPILVRLPSNAQPPGFSAPADPRT